MRTPIVGDYKIKVTSSSGPMSTVNSRRRPRLSQTVVILRRPSPEASNEKIGELFHVFKKMIKASSRKNILTFPLRFPPSVLREKRVCDAIAKLVERTEIRQYPLRNLVDTLHEIQLLKEI